MAASASAPYCITGAGGEATAAAATSVHPYLRWQDEDLSVWGTFGHGQGEYTQTPENLGKTIRTDLGMSMVGGGLRRTLVPAEESGGLELALRTDAMAVWMRSDRVEGYLQGTRTRTSHVRVLLEGGRSFELGSGAVLAPSVEVGVRHDAGDAETGLGMELGGGFRYAHPRRGLSVEAHARGRLAGARPRGGPAGARLERAPVVGRARERGRGPVVTLAPRLTW